MVKGNSKGGPSKHAKNVMLTTLLSTNLRIFIPVSVLFAVGFVIDVNYSVKPWGMLTGTCLGMVAAAILLAFQLRKINAKPKVSIEPQITEDNKVWANGSKC